MSALWVCLLLVAWLGAIAPGQGARILGIFPMASISHQLPFQALMKALAARGHQVTVVSPEPLKTPRENYTDVDLSFTYKHFRQALNFNDLVSKSPYQLLDATAVLGHLLVDIQLSSDVMQTFIKSNPKYDLVFIESQAYQAYYGLVHHVGSPPIIGIISMGRLTMTDDLVANPSNPAYDVNIIMQCGDRMNFWQRLNNMLVGLYARYVHYCKIFPDQERVMRKHFGYKPPPISKTDKNFSLVMVNNHWTMSHPRPLMPNFIELGNLHLTTTTMDLPEDLASFLDGAEHGFIYFSLGSNVRSDQLPEAKRRAFLEAFAALPQRVLWKWEAEEMPGKPPNVKLAKWVPQTDVLAHPKIRVFITQGGLQSFGEAVQRAVPLVGIPFMGDQGYNVQKIVSTGIGVRLNFQDMTKENILKCLKRVLDDPSYKRNIKKLSEISNDQLDTSLERGVWWTEYVLRHQGAPHLRSAALDLVWYQYLLLDVMAFLGLVLTASLVLIYVVVMKCTSLVSSILKAKSRND